MQNFKNFLVQFTTISLLFFTLVITPLFHNLNVSCLPDLPICEETVHE